MTQRKSWYDPNKLRKTTNAEGMEAGVIAQFFFPTDDSKFDTNDRAVMDQLAAGLREPLRRERVDLAIVGHADHRGSIRYNEALGQRRAKTVARELRRRLMDAPLFSHFVMLARGEQDSVQGTSDAQALAGDRRVDVMRATAVHLSDALRIEKVPQLQKVVHRQWFDFAKEAYGPDPKSHAKDLFEEGVKTTIELIKGPRRGPRGDEKFKDRRYRYFDATSQVQQVDIREHYKYSIGWNVEIETWDTYIDYKWGKPPIPAVKVTYHMTIEGDFPKGFEEKMARKLPYLTQIMSRESADKDPLLNPPPLAL